MNTAEVDKKDATKVVLTTYESLTDGKDYTFTYTAADEAKTQSTFKLTATDGTIDSLNLTPLTITAGKATTIKYQTLDKNGVVLSEKSIGSPATGIEVNTTNNDGYYTSAGNLYLANVDDSATIIVSYHTYKYDSTGLETGVIEKTFTVKAIDSAAAATYDYTIAKAAPYNWATAKKSTQIAMEDTAYKAYIRITDANGDVLSDAQASEYSVESSNNNVLIAAGTVDGAIALTPVAQGTAYLVVSKDGKSVTSLPVTVVAKRVLTTVQIANSSVTVATSSAVISLGSGDIGSAVVNVKTLDQYGTAMDLGAGAVTRTSKPATSDGTEVSATPSAGKVVVSANAAPAGTYGYKITFTDRYGNNKSGIFSVKVVKPGTSSSLKLAVAETDGTNGNGTTKSIDTTFSASNHDNKELHVYVVGVGSNDTIVNGRPLNSNVSVSAIKVSGSDGTVYAKMENGTTTVSSQAISVSALSTAWGNRNTTGELVIKVRDGYNRTSGDNIRKYLPAGVYTVTYTVKDRSGRSEITNTYTTQFTVKDEQPVTTVKVVEPNIGDQYLAAAFANADNAVFSYDGIALKDANGVSTVTRIKAVIGATASSGTKATVQYVVAAIPVSIDTDGVGGAEQYYIDTVVPVNVTFTGISGNLSVAPKDALKSY